MEKEKNNKFFYYLFRIWMFAQLFFLSFTELIFQSKLIFFTFDQLMKYQGAYVDKIRKFNLMKLDYKSFEKRHFLVCLLVITWLNWSLWRQIYLFCF